jgi:pimeloyl-ACP methyl ester carboxylesterase
MTRNRLLVLVILLLTKGGCAAPQGDRAAPLGPVVAAERRAEPVRAYLQHLPGVGGTRSIDRMMVRGLADAGLHAEIVVDDWTRGDPGLMALTSYDRNRAEAESITERLLERMQSEPDRPVFLTGHSGGGGMTVWVLENLPADVRVEAVVLLAPALSPGYDLSEALRRVRGNVYVFSSEYDWILGWGTRNFGTLDRHMTDAAGRVGFTVPEGADEEQYRKLIQLPYREEWTVHDNFGEHIGMMMTPFAREVIAPLLVKEGMPVIR